MKVIGLDLGGTKLSGALFDKYGRLSGKGTVLLENRTGDAVGQLINTELRRLIDLADKNNDEIASIGIAVPGICYPDSGNVWVPNIPDWNDYPLQEVIKSEVKNAQISITLDSDRACSVLGEVWQGNAVDCSNVIFMAVGTGIGAGILVNGAIIQGGHGAAGAIGWLALDRPYLEEYVSAGCFEHYASGTGIAKMAKSLVNKGVYQKSAVRSIPANEIQAQIIFEFAHKGDLLARAVVKKAVEYWGMAAANLVSLFDPQKIIFGGGVFGPALSYLNEIYQEARKWAQPVSISRVKFEGSALGPDAALFGAGKLAWKNQDSNN